MNSKEWKGPYKCETCGTEWSNKAAHARSLYCTQSDHKKGDFVRLIPYDRRTAEKAAPDSGLRNALRGYLDSHDLASSDAIAMRDWIETALQASAPQMPKEGEG